MMTIDFETLFNPLSDRKPGIQKRVSVNSPVHVFYGVSSDGYLRLAFLTSSTPPTIQSTRLIRIVQGEETQGVFWTCFDLLDENAQSAFFAFCRNMLEAVVEADSERSAMNNLRKRYANWKALFRSLQNTSVSKEKVQGLFGELYFLDGFMTEKYGVDSAVSSWGGPDDCSKDFSINTDWYEIKTIGTSVDTVTINSLAQLTSENDGKLVVVRVERMSEKYSNGKSCISELVSSILNSIESEAIESAFLDKLALYGIPITDDTFAVKFEVKKCTKYSVVEGFPRITLNSVPFSEITNASYSISLAGINRFKEE